MTETLDNQGQDPYPDRIQDPEQTQAMALAGDELRTQARDERRKAKIARAFKLQYEAAEDDTKREIMNKVCDFADVHMLERPDSIGIHNLTNRDKLEEEIPRNIASFFERLPLGYENSAERLDKDAWKREVWAGILHEYPVSETYIARYPDVEFTPNGLIKLERDEVQKWRFVQYDRARCEESEAYINGLGWISHIENYREPEDIEEEYDDSELDTLLSSNETTIGELKAHVIKRHREHNHKRALDAMKTSALLASVRLGRASLHF